jgi:hypothetical protein
MLAEGHEERGSAVAVRVLGRVERRQPLTVVRPPPQSIVEAHGMDKRYDTGKFTLASIFVVVSAIAMATTFASARRATRVYAAEAFRYR